jgi:hypothetical protein
MLLAQLVTIPFALALGAASVSATLTLDPAPQLWNVNVVISRQPNQPPVDASEVDAKLFDAEGHEMEAIERPKGALAEAGTSLSSSVNAPFKFRSTKAAPAILVVGFRGATVEFAIGSPPPGSPPQER